MDAETEALINARPVRRSPRAIRPGQCSVCSHPERARIELLRAGGASLNAIAKRFGVSRDSVHRHFRNHVSRERRAELVAGPAAVEQLAQAAADESKSLLDYLAITRAVLFNQFLNAAEAGDRAHVANVAGRLLESLREIGRITGELREVSGITVNHNTLNVIGSPEFAALSEGLLNIARTHPAAKADIVVLLRNLDAKQPGGLARGLPAPAGRDGTAVPERAAYGLRAPRIEVEAARAP